MNNNNELFNNAYNSLCNNSDHDHKVTQQIVSTYLVTLSEELKKAIPTDGECRPELIVGRSEILDIDDICNISDHFLGNTQWCPIFSTSLHKRSLEGLFDRIKESFENGCKSPVLILVKDTTKRIFGALLSSPIQDTDQPYEVDHSVIFHCKPNFEIFQNMRETKCKIMSRNESLSITHIGGKGELSLNEDLTAGRADDEPDTTEDSEFVIKTVECWIFGASSE